MIILDSIFTTTICLVMAQTALVRSESDFYSEGDLVLHGFKFTPFKDSQDGDLEHVDGDLLAMAERCNTIPSCLGFNTNGFLKDTLKPESDWYEWTDDPKKGFYKKESLHLQVDGYEFTPFKDSQDGDVEYVDGDLLAMAERCNTIPSCLGFNTNGFLKDTLKPESDWHEWTDDPNKGFYKKEGLHLQVCGYEFTPFKDSQYGDVEYVDGDLLAMAERCNAIPSCLGFNTNGFLKDILKPESDWNEWTDDPRKGFYVKKPSTSSSPSQSPSQSPTSFEVDFRGFKDAYSIMKGKIDLSWSPPIVQTDYSENDLYFDIFVATGEYDFTATENVEDLIHLFEANEDYQHIQVPGNLREMSIDTTNLGQVHTLLITAQVSGVYSTNRRGSKVVVARFSPHVKDEVHIIGVFVPTENIRIDLEDAQVGEEHFLTFSGSGVTDEAKSLKTGDYFSGFTSELNVFIRFVVGQDTLEDNLVILRVVDIPLEGIFDQLDLDGVFGVSREDEIQGTADRKLFLSFFEDAVNWVGDGVKAIGGVIEDVAEAIYEFAEFVVTGELEEKFGLLDLHETWEEDIIPDVAVFSGGVHFVAELVIQIHIDGIQPDFFRVGVEADYSCDSVLTLGTESAIGASEEIDLWSGSERSRLFMLGPVPVEAYWKPKIDLRLEASASYSASAKIGIKVEGRTEISAIYDRNHNPTFYESFTPPSLDPTYCLDIEAGASLEASATVVISMDVGLYRGLLSANTGIGIGLVIESGLGFEQTQTWSQFDLMARFSIPFKADALYEEYAIAEGNIYQNDWPILSLPSLETSSGFLSKYACSCSQMCSLDGDWDSVGSGGPCSGDQFFDRLSDDLSEEFNNNIFLAISPDPADPPFPSTKYKFEDFMHALKKLQNTAESLQMWLGDDCTVASQKMAFVNLAAFLGQAMRETIIYDACDENNWDKWHSADIPKDPNSPAEYLPALYPMSSSCGQLGQNYAQYDCDDACPEDPNMEIFGSTHANWIGAPPPLFCGPKSKYDGIGYWNPMLNCPNGVCEGQPFHYEGQSAGVYVPANEDDKYPEVYYTNPIGEMSPRNDFPSTNVEGCCWWGRGVIQTTGRCNFGKLNKNIGSSAGDNALYPDQNFCRNPQAICDGPSELKWIAGIFFWVSDPQVYDRDGFNYKEGVKRYVNMGCADDPDKTGCDFLFEYASSIVNRGCHDPGETGCPDCIPGATCGPAHNIPERVEASKKALRALMQLSS